MTRTALALALAGALALTALAAGPAAAARPANTKVTIHEIELAPGDFAGDALSPRRSCKVDRKVVVFKVQGGADLRMGSDFTDSDTSWLVVTDETEGSFYAKAPKTPRCQGATSPIIEIPS